MTAKRSHIRIDQLAFTGPERLAETLPFGDGVNIVWGASNSGKSFVRKSIDYVVGGDKLTLPPQGKGYDSALLWLTLPNGELVTLRRSIFGGDVYKAAGHVLDVDPSSSGYEVLGQKHTKAANVSKFLLAKAGFREARLLKNERADKSTFSLRLLMRYLLVDETRMIDEKSVLLSHNTTVTSEDKGLIKFLLTGVDGSSVEPVRSSDELKAARDGKIEVLSQLADELRETIDESIDIDEKEADLDKADNDRNELHTVLSKQQDALDAKVIEVRSLDEKIRGKTGRIAELNAMTSRFVELAAIYASDIDRLRGLEEGGFLLQRFASISCPLCGADPAHQVHDHGLGAVEEQRQAVEAEIAKISADAAELDKAIADVRSEVLFEEENLSKLNNDRNKEAGSQRAEMEREVSARAIFTLANKQFQEISADIKVRQRLLELERLIGELSNQSVRSRQRAAGIDLNLDLTQSEAHELSQVIKGILVAWNYPGADAVHFEKGDHDIVVDGKRRRDNGAGVRALLHSAFKVGVLVYCIQKGRPHPGFLILDSPLLAYRPAEEGRFGAVLEDEIALRDAGVAHNFYTFLHNMRDKAQFIVIENHRSDQEVVEQFPNVRFTLDPEFGRVGLFG